MRVRLMGTAAAEGWPAVWCGCDACSRARAAGGKNVRTRSGALIDDDLKIDLPPDTYMQALRDGIELSKVRSLFITHTHADHYYLNELAMAFAPFAHERPPLQIFGDRWAIEGILEAFPNWPQPENLQVVEPYQMVDVEGTEILPLRAAHFPGRGGLNFIVRRGGKTLLYGMDSGWFPDDSWEAQQAFRFDIVILDCTHGPIPAGAYHGGIDSVIATKERMLKDGTATDETIFVANHFSHNGGLLHEELEEQLSPHGILVAYDGLVLEA